MKSVRRPTRKEDLPPEVVAERIAIESRRIAELGGWYASRVPKPKDAAVRPVVIEREKQTKE